MKTVSAVLHIGEEGESVINSAGVLLMLPLSSSPRCDFPLTPKGERDGEAREAETRG